MREIVETGGVMGHIANSDNLPSRVNFNHDNEAKKNKTNEVAAKNQGVAKLVEEAAAKGNQVVMERIVNRYRWDMDD